MFNRKSAYSTASPSGLGFLFATVGFDGAANQLDLANKNKIGYAVAMNYYIRAINRCDYSTTLLLRERTGMGVHRCTFRC
jgi:hypothetical protein